MCTLFQRERMVMVVVVRGLSSQPVGHDLFKVEYQIACISDIYIVIHYSGKITVVRATK